MISVQNHLPRLNGNKIVAFFLLPILLISCGAFRKSTGNVEWPADDEEVVIVAEPKKPIPETKPTDPVIDEKNTAYSSVFFKGEFYKVPKHKNQFNIAVLLPFHENGKNSIQDEKRSALMLEYYQGIKLAVPEIEKLGSKFIIHFFDTDNDTTRLKLLLNKPEMDKMDLIIGPTDEDQVRIAAYFAKKHEIPLFSPITTNYNVWSNNPYLFNLNASDKLQAQAFIRYLKKYHKGEKLVVLRDGKKYDLGFGAALVEELKTEKISYSLVPYSKYVKWGDYLGENKSVIFSTAQDKTNMLYTVNSLLGRAGRVTLIGPDNWLDFSSIDFANLERLNVCFMGTNAAEVPNSQSIEMLTKFHTQYKGEPSWFTYMGYDQILFACELLDAFGSLFPLFIENKIIPYSNTSFNLVQIDNSYNNRYIQLFQYKEKELISLSVE